MFDRFKKECAGLPGWDDSYEIFVRWIDTEEQPACKERGYIA